MSQVVRGQAAIGLTLAGAILAAWIALHVLGVYGGVLHRAPWPVLVLMLAAQTWLSVGLFIVAHDAMHGSLAPGSPRLNRAIGSLCLLLYAGFPFRPLAQAHMDHHRAPGTAEDPDFHVAAPTRFLPWFLAFFRRYFGWREFAVMSFLASFALFVLRAPLPDLLLFWAVPAWASAAQLFYYGTYLPHRRGGVAFADRHNARSSARGSLHALLTCFNFGHHREHHQMPGVPWWRLDGVARRLRTAADDERAAQAQSL
ncbi:fatty acid desaturase [Zavarzinia sp. CC-PAN008]|uniref:fatty acid desaturase n=1 Tax=Zavarzinia sp. CC-PAN008 TaxID=3243332 RepID=UPI003F748E52